MKKIKLNRIIGTLLFVFPMLLTAQNDTLSLSELRERVKSGAIEVKKPVEGENDTASEEGGEKKERSRLGKSNAMQKVFYQSIDDAIYLVRQDYGVKKSNGKVSVKPDKKYWGQAYGIGVMSQKRMYLAKSVQEPWRNDKSYKKVDEGKGKPFALRLALCPIAKTDLETIKVKPVPINDQVGSYRFKEYNYKSVRGSAGKKEGYVVIFYTTDDVGPDMKVKKKVMRFNPNWKGGTDEAAKSSTLDVNMDETILGGAYFEQLISTGRIEFKLAGLYDDGKIWSVSRSKANKEKDDSKKDDKGKSGFDG